MDGWIDRTDLYSIIINIILDVQLVRVCQIMIKTTLEFAFRWLQNELDRVSPFYIPLLMYPSIHLSTYMYLSIYPSLKLFVYLSIPALILLTIHSSIHPLIHSSIHPSVHPSIHLSIHSSLHPYIHSFFHPSMHSFIYPSIPSHPFIHPFIHQSIHSSIHSSICLSIPIFYTQRQYSTTSYPYAGWSPPAQSNEVSNRFVLY